MLCMCAILTVSRVKIRLLEIGLSQDPTSFKRDTRTTSEEFSMLGQGSSVNCTSWQDLNIVKVISNDDNIGHQSVMATFVDGDKC